jgi:WD40 repeat protein
MPESEVTESSRIIVVDSPLGNVGVIVDAVTEVVTLQQDEIESTPAIVSETETDFVRGVAKRNDHLITLLLDLCWSKTQFLLSASMDKTVRLWHVSMDECLRVFKHTDFVTAIDFHPLDDKMFLSGSIDGKVRLWNIPEQRVVSWQDVHEMVTAVAYSQDGRKAVVGTMKGKCRFYTIEKSALEYEAQLGEALLIAIVACCLY